jgi:hypothetical protein
MSSSSGSPVLPGDCLVVGLAVLEAGVEDADPAVDELAQRLAVGLAAYMKLAAQVAGAW